MRPDEPMAEALRGALEPLASKLKKRLRLAAEGDSEAIHDARTTIRRLREGLAVMGRTAIDLERVASVEERLHELEQTLGPTRDDDVLLESVQRWTKGAARELRDGIEPLARRLRRRRKKHARALAKDLDRGRMRKAARRIRQFVGRTRRTTIPPRGRAHAVPTLVRHFVADETWRAYEEVLAYDTRMPSADFDVIHELRSACRRLRYRLELFDGAVPRGAADLVQALGALQDRLGDLHDDVVAVARLERWLAVGSLKRTKAIDGYLQERKKARDRRRDELGREWEALSGPAFRRAVANVAAGG